MAFRQNSKRGRWRAHAENLLNSLQPSMQEVDANYQSAIVYYNKMRTQFLSMLQDAGMNEIETSSEAIMTAINEKYENDINRGKMFSSTQKIVNNTIERVKEIVADIVTDNNTEEIQNLNEAWNNYQYHAQVSGEQAATEAYMQLEQLIIDFLLNELKLSIIQEIKKASHSSVEIDFTDLLNKILIPTIKGVMRQMIQQNQTNPAINVNIQAAAGYFFEQQYAQTFADLFQKLTTMSMGAKNTISDTIVTSLTNSDLDNIDENIKTTISQVETAINSCSVINTQTITDLFDSGDLSRLQSKIFGIQNKIYDLDLTTGSDYRFAKVSNQSDMLSEFLSTKLNGQNYVSADTHAQAIVFISEFKRILKIFGHLNVLLGEGSKTVWTGDALQSLRNKGMFLTFRTTEKGTFTKVVGTQRFVFSEG